METRIEITEETLDIAAVDSFLRRAEGGAVNLFVGTTRRITGEKVTVDLRYEAARELARAEIDRLLRRAGKQWPVLRAVVLHRTGMVPVGEASVIIGVATPHREESFQACRFLIDELKQRVPIWKRETFDDGTSEWVEGAVPDEGLSDSER
jgi:molybdopterin synthase catalytic subunit